MKMLQQIRQILPDGWSRTRRALGMESVRWHPLKPGQTVCFGPMKQEELNQAKPGVVAVKEYEFSQGRFLAYLLQSQGQPPLWMIVADAQGQTPYLAISRKLSKEQLEDVLSPDDVQVITHSSRLKHLLLREQTPGLRDWITLRYERRIEGVRGKQRENGTERVFEYELYVSEDDSRAIEIERYLDGHMDAYATIYRPASDVLEVLDAPRRAAAPAAASKAQTPPSPLKAPAPAPKTRAPSPLRTASLQDVEQTRKINRQAPVVKASATARPATTGRIECDISTAWRLIDEALRGGMRLSDVVRKVLGLPVQASDLISFDFTLSEEDYVHLAQRYGLNPQNQLAIRTRIVQELEAFAGKGSK